MTPENVSRSDDEGLYQPRIHSRHIRELHKISEEIGVPMTVILDGIVSDYIDRYFAESSCGKIICEHKAEV